MLAINDKHGEVTAPPKAVYWQAELHDPAGQILKEKVAIENEAQ